jgi:hypothetical protein
VSVVELVGGTENGELLVCSRMRLIDWFVCVKSYGSTVSALRVFNAHRKTTKRRADSIGWNL